MIARWVSSARFAEAASRRAMALGSPEAGASNSETPATPMSFGATAAAGLGAPLPLRRPSQSVTQSGVSAGRKGSAASALIHKSARTCLQGNLRDGQVHLFPRSRRSAITRYGLAPDPAHSPQISAPSWLTPIPDHFPGFARPAAAFSELWSAARASTARRSTIIPVELFGHETA